MKIPARAATKIRTRPTPPATQAIIIIVVELELVPPRN